MYIRTYMWSRSMENTMSLHKLLSPFYVVYFMTPLKSVCGISISLVFYYILLEDKLPFMTWWLICHYILICQIISNMTNASATGFQFMARQASRTWKLRIKGALLGESLCNRWISTPKTSNTNSFSIAGHHHITSCISNSNFMPCVKIHFRCYICYRSLGGA